MTSTNTQPTNLPKGWVWTSISETCKTTSGGTPNRKREDFFNGNIPWLKSGELNYNRIFETEEKITEEALQNSSAKLFPKGTLLIALYGATVGRLGLLEIEASTNQAVAAIFTPDFLNKNYLFWFLFYHRPLLLKERFGGAQPNISQTILSEIEFPLPPLAEQHRIVAKIEELFSDLEHSVAALETARAQLKIYRQAVLKYAFEGKLTEQWRQQHTPPPAAELLAQIQAERAKNDKQAKPLPPLTEAELAELPGLPEGWCWVKLGEAFEVFVGATPSITSDHF